MDYTKTGQLIAQARREKGMTQRDLANRLHITDRAVSKWERGVSFPDVATLEPLSEVLGLPLSQLITGASDGTATEETLQESVQTFKKELKTKIWRTAWLTAAMIAGVAVLITGICILWRYVPAQRTAIREMHLSTKEMQIAGTNGLSAAKFHIQMAPDVQICYLLEETWAPYGLVSSEPIWATGEHLSAAIIQQYNPPASSWIRTRKTDVVIGFSLNSTEHTYTWNCLTADGPLHQYSGTYPDDIYVTWCQSYRDLTRTKLSKENAVPLMAVYLAKNTVPGRFGLDGLKPGAPVPVMDGGMVKVLWLIVK